MKIPIYQDSNNIKQNNSDQQKHFYLTKKKETTENKMRNKNNKNSSSKNSTLNKKIIDSSEFIGINLNDKFTKSDEKDDKIPLIEKIITIGIKPSEILFLEKNINNYCNKNKLNEIINPKIYDIIFESNTINMSINDNDYPNRENLLLYVFNKSFQYPKIILDERNSYKYEIFSFTTYNNLKRKHYSCLKYYERYYLKDKVIYCQNALLFISNFQIYNTMFTFQSKIIDIYLNNRKYNRQPEKLEYVILKISRINTSKINEIKFIPLYLNIILNSIYHINPFFVENKKYSNNYLPLFKDEDDSLPQKYVYGSCCKCNKIGLNFLESKNICLVILNSNENKNRIFLKYHTSIIKENIISNLENLDKEKIICENMFYQPITIPDINISDLLFKFFSSSNLILMYLFLLTEQKIFLIFENINEINLIIFSLLNLLNPLKWNLPIISFITEDQSDLFETPFSLIIGIPNELKNSLIKILNKTGDECVIYDLKDKIFLKVPSGFNKLIEKNYFLELKSELENIKSLSIKFEIDLEEKEREILKLFPTLELNDFQNIDHKVYLSLIIILTFYKFLIKNIFFNFLQSLNIEKITQLKRSNEKIENINIFNYFDNNIFSKSEDNEIQKILNMIGRSMIITQFIFNFIFDKNINLQKEFRYNDDFDFNDKFNSIYESIFYFLKMKNSLKEKYINFIIKKRLIEYYKFSYFSVDQLLKITYMDKENHKRLEINQKEILSLINIDLSLNHKMFPICKYKIPIDINDLYSDAYSKINDRQESLSLNINNSYCQTEVSLLNKKYKNIKDKGSKNDINDNLKKYSHFSIISEDIKKLEKLKFFNLYNKLSKYHEEMTKNNTDTFIFDSNDDEINDRNKINNNESKLKNSLKNNKLNSNKIFSRNLNENIFISNYNSEVINNEIKKDLKSINLHIKKIDNKDDLLKNKFNDHNNLLHSRNNFSTISRSLKNLNLDLSNLIENNNKTSIISQINFKQKIKKNSKKFIHNHIIDLINNNESKTFLNEQNNIFKKIISNDISKNKSTNEFKYKFPENNIINLNKNKSNLEIMIGDNDCDLNWDD